MEPLTLVIPGPPVPWAAKATNQRTGNRFIPSRQADATGRVIWAATQLIERGHSPFVSGEPLALSAEFYVKRPKYHYGTGRNAGVLKGQYVDARPTGKPDLSNLVKLVEDGMVLAGLLPDDDQIVEFLPPGPRKLYTRRLDEQPRSVIRIGRLG